jgi:hypothetical protein
MKSAYDCTLSIKAPNYRRTDCCAVCKHYRERLENRVYWCVKYEEHFFNNLRPHFDTCDDWEGVDKLEPEKSIVRCECGGEAKLKEGANCWWVLMCNKCYKACTTTEKDKSIRRWNESTASRKPNGESSSNSEPLVKSCYNCEYNRSDRCSKTGLDLFRAFPNYNWHCSEWSSAI